MKPFGFGRGRKETNSCLSPFGLQIKQKLLQDRHDSRTVDPIGRKNDHACMAFFPSPHACNMPCIDLFKQTKAAILKDIIE